MSELLGSPLLLDNEVDDAVTNTDDTAGGFAVKGADGTASLGLTAHTIDEAASRGGPTSAPNTVRSCAAGGVLLLPFVPVPSNRPAT